MNELKDKLLELLQVAEKIVMESKTSTHNKQLFAVCARATIDAIESIVYDETRNKNG